MTKFFLTTLPERLGKFEAILKSREEGKSFFFGDKVNKQDKYVTLTHSRAENSAVTFWRRTDPTDLKPYPSHFMTTQLVEETGYETRQISKMEKKNSAAFYVIGA